MAENEAQAASKRSVKETDGIDQRTLEEVAQRMYVDLANGRMRLRDSESIARQAYIEAASFLRVTMEFRNGKPISRPHVQERPLFVMVHLWNMADTEKTSNGSPMNDQNGAPMYELSPVDRYAWAPKLHKGHPINQRFLGNAINNTIRGPNGEQVPALCTQHGKPLTADEIKELREYSPESGGAV